MDVEISIFNALFNIFPTNFHSEVFTRRIKELPVNKSSPNLIIDACEVEIQCRCFAFE